VGRINLIDAMGVEFKASKRWLAAALWMNLLLYIIALTGIFSSGWMTKAAAIGAIVIQTVAFAASVFMGKRYSLGEKIRRVAMLKHSLGIEPSVQDVTTIATEVGFPDSSGRSFVGDYYASSAPVGQNRLLEILDECAYWTAQGALKTRNFLIAGVVVAGMVVLLSFIVVVQAGLSNEKVVKVFISTVSFIALGDLGSLAMKFSYLSGVANSVLTQCEGLARSPELDKQPLITTGEYNCVLASAGTPVPNWIYKRYQADWNEAYEERRSALFGIRKSDGANASGKNG
jgi:hypothetical protein